MKEIPNSKVINLDNKRKKAREEGARKFMEALFGKECEIRETPKLPPYPDPEEPSDEDLKTIEVANKAAAFLEEEEEANQRRENIGIVGSENNLGDENEEMQPSESTDKTDDSTSEATILPFPKKS